MIAIDDFDPDGSVPLHECCICGQQPVTAIATIQDTHFPFCASCDHRSAILRRGQSAGWPALRVEGVTGTYALDSDAHAYLLTALQGTDERVVELLDALDEYGQSAA